jgi:hypothetical protein
MLAMSLESWFSSLQTDIKIYMIIVCIFILVWTWNVSSKSKLGRITKSTTHKILEVGKSYDIRYHSGIFRKDIFRITPQADCITDMSTVVYYNNKVGIYITIYKNNLPVFAAYLRDVDFISDPFNLEDDEEN